jgi:hypothetical protein
VAVPDRLAFRAPVLEVLASGEVLSTEEIRARVKQRMALSDEDCAEMHPNSANTKFRNFVAWAYVDLQERALIEKVSVTPNRYRATASGRDADPLAESFEETFPKYEPITKESLDDALEPSPESQPEPAVATQRVLGQRRPFDAENVPSPAEAEGGLVDEPRRLALAEQARKLHHHLLCRLMSRLVESGWSSIDEIPGDIDMLAEDPRGVTWYFEAKTIHEGNELSQTRSGFAQLMEYRVRFGDSHTPLCLVVDRSISDRRADLLEALGVGVIVADGMTVRPLNDPAAEAFTR